MPLRGNCFWRRSSCARASSNFAWLARLDPTDRRFAELVEAAVALGGRTGAEVIDQRGVVVTATERERVLLPGRFVDVYLRRLAVREPVTAIATPSAQPDSEPYLVAFTPLKNAPWPA